MHTLNFKGRAQARLPDSGRRAAHRVDRLLPCEVNLDVASICKKELHTFASTFNSEVVVSVYWCSLLTCPNLSTGGFQAVQDNRQATGVAELEGVVVITTAGL